MKSKDQQLGACKHILAAEVCVCVCAHISMSGRERERKRKEEKKKGRKEEGVLVVA